MRDQDFARSSEVGIAQKKINGVGESIRGIGNLFRDDHDLQMLVKRGAAGTSRDFSGRFEQGIPSEAML